MQQPGPDYTSSYYAPYNHQQPPPQPPYSHQQPPPQPPYTTTDHPPSYASAPPFSALDHTSSFSDPQPPSIGPQAHGLYYPPAQYSPSNYEPIPQNYPTYESHQTPNPSYHHNNPNFDYGSGYFDDNLSGYGNYGPINSNLGGIGGYDYDYENDGVYAYEGKSEPYGARGTGSKSSTSFDDYGRPITVSNEEKASSFKVVKAVPKAETDSDVNGGVHKFRVKLLPETADQSVVDVLCMVGLDGIRMLDPNTNRTLRIYPLETVTRCDKYDSSTFAFWAKTSVDFEPKRIRLQSSSYTTNTILDIVTASIVQFKEMGGSSRPSELPKALEQSADKKNGLTDWINKLKPVNEEKDHWVPDEAVSKCSGCRSDFNAFNRRHHCRNCGDIFCDKCTQGRTPLTAEDNAPAVRVCDACMAQVTERLDRANEAVTRTASTQSHENLAKKLQEEMEKNLKISSGSKSEVSDRRMREVACPTCTVHLQVQVPTSGSETIECGVCQHPFLVSAH